MGAYLGADQSTAATATVAEQSGISIHTASREEAERLAGAALAVLDEIEREQQEQQPETQQGRGRGRRGQGQRSGHGRGRGGIGRGNPARGAEDEVK